MNYRGSVHLPGELRDETLRALADILGLDFWALDEVTKEDAARVIIEALDLEVSDDIVRSSKSVLRDEIKKLGDNLERVAEELSDAEDAIVELREFREDVCAMFGVKVTEKPGAQTETIDRPIGDVLDDLSDARQALEDKVEAWVDAYWDLRCSTYQALGLDATRNEKATLSLARMSEVSLGDLSPRETVDDLVAVMDLAQVAEIVGLPRSATGVDVAQAVRGLAEKYLGLKAKLLMTWSDEAVKAQTDALDEIVDLLGFDPNSRGIDAVRAVRNLVEKHETLLSAYKAKIEVQALLEKIPDSGPLRGVL